MWRWIVAFAVTAAGLIAALWEGAPFLPVAIALIGGFVGGLVAPLFRTEAPVSRDAPSSGEAEGPELPQALDVMDAVDEPRLIVRNRRVLLANRAAKKMLGEHIEGVDVRLAIRHPAAAERLTERTEEAARTSTELVGLGEPGRRWEMTTSRLDDGSRLVRLTDRSEAHLAEQMRVDFVANASHELRTPLATVLGFLETLQDDEVAEDGKVRGRFLKIMSDEASRMRQLVDDLMSLSRIEAERFSVPREPVDLLPLVAEVHESLRNLLEARQSQVKVEQRAGGTIVAGDRPQLAQLLNNLLSNAAKYGRVGAPVRLLLEDAGQDMLSITVIDEGDGIPPEHLPRLTERFYRVDPGRSRSVGGTGLGLAIVKHIVGRHRGRLDIRSKVGAGTSVQVLLPRGAELHSVIPGWTRNPSSFDGA